MNLCSFSLCRFHWLKQNAGMFPFLVIQNKACYYSSFCALQLSFQGDTFIFGIERLDAVSALDIYLSAGVPVPDLIAHFLLHFYFVAFQEEKIGKAK